MPETYVCRTALKQGRVALAYAIQEEDEYMAEKSLIKVFKQGDEKPINQIEITGEVSAIRSLPWGDLLAVTTEGSREISIFNPAESKLQTILLLDSTVKDLLVTQGELIATSMKGQLHIYSQSSFPLPRTIEVESLIKSEVPKVTKVTTVINSMAASENFLFCDVWSSTADDRTRLSQVMVYNSRTGALLSALGKYRFNKRINNSFLVVLDNKYVVEAIVKQVSCEVNLYEISTRKRLKTLEIHPKGQYLLSGLPSGGLAVYREQVVDMNRVAIYHLLESDEPKMITSSSMSVSLNTQEDVIFFLANEERQRLCSYVTDRRKLLKSLSFFPDPLEQLITGYSLPSEALTDGEVDQFVYQNWPKS